MKKPMQLLQSLGQVDDTYITEAAAPRAQSLRRGWLRWGVPAACLALALAIGIPMLPVWLNRLPLSDGSRNVEVRYVNQVPAGSVSVQSLLEWLSEDELLTRWNPVLVRGTVRRIRNLEIRFGSTTAHRALAEIAVETVYRGAVEPDTVIRVLLPCPIGTGIWVEDTEIVAQMQAGMPGIFILIDYDEQAIWQQNNGTLKLSDIADFGLSDGRRFAFLESADGLVFARHDYPSLAGAADLDAVEQFLLESIGNN
ncbi:MAG: hypothetical protein PHG76_08105 [Eubacteriales bacterium]|jgi:hypothetical protein|nr:hypothetical protein [Eubacteriales bacterium]